MLKLASGPNGRLEAGGLSLYRFPKMVCNVATALHDSIDRDKKYSS